MEHYIVSTGLRQMIKGSAIASHVKGIWACEFIENIAPPAYHDNKQGYLPIQEDRIISQIAYTIDNTTKTRAVFEINKGTNKIAEISVNSNIKHEDRRVPFPNMIYIADGPSDIPVFSVLNQYGGKTFAVYKPGDAKEFSQVNELQKQGRVQGFGEANYNSGSQTHMWIVNTAVEIAERIVADRTRALGERIGGAPKHLV